MPKRNSKIGKEIKQKLDSCIEVTIEELNRCIDFDGAPFNIIGFARNNKKYFGFTVLKEWNIKIPSDCNEITQTEYDKLFKDDK